MKVCAVNTYERTGGAAVACKRVMDAIGTHDDIEVSLLVAIGASDQENVIRLDRKLLRKWKSRTSMVMERLRFKPYHNGQINEFYFSPALNGMDISSHPAILEADIIHFHWINLGFLSVRGIQKLASLNKPVVWTLHDMWAFTGGCHYTGSCDHFTSGCGRCMFLRRPGAKDLSYRLNRQKSFFRDFHFCTSSRWLQREAQRSSILKDIPVSQIHTPVDLDVFRPVDRSLAKEKLGLDPGKRYILFGAANLDDKRKGFDYLLQAMDMLKSTFQAEKPEILLFGKISDDQITLPFRVTSLGSISDMETIALIYNAADLFVIPSMQDNLPNTIIESHACGTPVVGFDTAGVTEMIDHHVTGYLARFKDADDLAHGIRYVLEQEDMRNACRDRALAAYSPADCANEYYQLYRSLLPTEPTA